MPKTTFKSIMGCESVKEYIKWSKEVVEKGCPDLKLNEECKKEFAKNRLNKVFELVNKKQKCLTCDKNFGLDTIEMSPVSLLCCGNDEKHICCRCYFSYRFKNGGDRLGCPFCNCKGKTWMFRRLNNNDMVKLNHKICGIPNPKQSGCDFFYKINRENID